MHNACPCVLSSTFCSLLVASVILPVTLSRTVPFVQACFECRVFAGLFSPTSRPRVFLLSTYTLYRSPNPTAPTENDEIRQNRSDHSAELRISRYYCSPPLPTASPCDTPPIAAGLQFPPTKAYNFIESHVCSTAPSSASRSTDHFVDSSVLARPAPELLRELEVSLLSYDVRIAA
jgi:hypothetical protein